MIRADRARLPEQKGNVVSLFDRTGVMVQPWLDAGYPCWIVDTFHARGVHQDGRLYRVGCDVRAFDLNSGDNANAIVFAFPPCTNLSGSGARVPRPEPRAQELTNDTSKSKEAREGVARATRYFQEQPARDGHDASDLPRAGVDTQRAGGSDLPTRSERVEVAAVLSASAPSQEQLQAELTATKKRMWELGHECDRLQTELNAASARSRPLEDALRELVEACERDFCSRATDECGDEESVGGGMEGDCAVTFGMIRRAKAALVLARDPQEP